MNILKLSSRKVLGLAVASLLLVPAHADGKDDSVVVRCKGTVTKADSPTDKRERVKLSPLKKLKKNEYLVVFPGSSITLMSFADCSKMTIAVPAGEKPFVSQVSRLATSEDPHISRETNNDYKAVHVQSEAYQSKIGGASNRALALDGHIIYTDRETPRIIVNARAATITPKRFWIQLIKENGQDVAKPTWRECKVVIKPGADVDHTELVFSGLKLKPSQIVDVCLSETPVAANADAWMRLLRYDLETIKQVDAELKTPKNQQEALNYLSYLTRAHLFDRAFECKLGFEKQFRDPAFWPSVQANLDESRDLGQKVSPPSL